MLYTSGDAHFFDAMYKVCEINLLQRKIISIKKMYKTDL